MDSNHPAFRTTPRELISRIEDSIKNMTSNPKEMFNLKQVVNTINSLLNTDDSPKISEAVFVSAKKPSNLPGSLLEHLMGTPKMEEYQGQIILGRDLTQEFMEENNLHAIQSDHVKKRALQIIQDNKNNKKPAAKQWSYHKYIFPLIQLSEFSYMFH